MHRLKFHGRKFSPALAPIFHRRKFSPALALITFALALVLAGCGGSGDSSSGPHRDSQLTGHSFGKALVLVFENADYSAAIKDANFAAFAARGALFENYSGSIHPSQGNYIAMTAGDAYSVKTDANVTLAVRHVGDLLDEAGISWKSYAEGYPGNCYLGATSGKYARKHVPFLSFKDVTSDPARCDRVVVNADVFWSDVATGTVPDFAFYTPDLNNDGHDTGVAYAGRWLKAKIFPLLDDPSFMKDRIVIATFDEGGSSNHVYTAIVGTGVAPGTRDNGKYDHSSLVRTFEEAWGLPGLGRKDEAASPFQNVW